VVDPLNADDRELRKRAAMTPEPIVAMLDQF